MISEDDIERCRFGKCYFFAAAMARLAGGRIGGASGVRLKRRSLAHAWVVSEDGRMFDASGEISDDDVRELFFDPFKYGKDCAASLRFHDFPSEDEMVSWLIESEPHLEIHIREMFDRMRDEAEDFARRVLGTEAFSILIREGAPSP